MDEKRRQTIEHIMVVCLVFAFIVLIYLWYMTFMYQPYPYSDPDLLGTDLGTNESLVIIKMIDSLDERAVEGVYCRITNPVTEERWEYLSNDDGKLWVIAKDTESLNTYISAEGYHSELVSIIISMSGNQTVIHGVKPFNKIRFIVQVSNTTHGIQGAEVYFDGSSTPRVTDESGLAFIEIDDPRKIIYTIVPPEEYGEPYSSEYTVDDHWVWDKVTVFFEKTPPPNNNTIIT